MTWAAERLASGLGVSRPVGAILARRGFASVDEARRFLAADERHDPLTLPGVAGRLRADRSPTCGAARGSRSSATTTWTASAPPRSSCAPCARSAATRSGSCRAASTRATGSPTAAVERLAARGVDLLVTVDCGITAVEQVAAARAAGLDVVVTDHHRPGDQLPDCAVVHPALPVEAEPPTAAPSCAPRAWRSSSPRRCTPPPAATRRRRGALDLAALATVCDLVPLRGENRRIVREGLAALARTRKPGPARADGGRRAWSRPS